MDNPQSSSDIPTDPLIGDGKVSSRQEAKPRLKKNQVPLEEISDWLDKLCANSESLTNSMADSETKNALKSTLMRVHKPKLDELLEHPERCPSTAEKLYLWCLPNSNISLPCLSLKDYTEKSKKPDTAWSTSKYWGLDRGEIVLPKEEGVCDSNMWYLLKETIRSKWPDSLKENGFLDDSLPDLSNETVEKDTRNLAHILMRRILNLLRSPNSCTTRTTGMKKESTVIENAIDFVVIDHRKSLNPIYKDLEYSEATLSCGRRTEKVPLTKKSSKKETVLHDVYVGYRLSEYLLSLQIAPKKKNPENEKFFVLIQDILKRIAEEGFSKEDPSKEETLLTKGIFRSASDVLRGCLREGPEITTKKDKLPKRNIYPPFSFVKSSECRRYPIAERKKLLETSSNVLTYLDSVNKYSVAEMGQAIKLHKEYLKTNYSNSDEYRRLWRTSLKVPKMVTVFKIVCEEYEKARKGTMSDLEAYMANHFSNLSMTGATEGVIDTDLVPQYLKEIEEINAKRKDPFPAPKGRRGV